MSDFATAAPIGIRWECSLSDCAQAALSGSSSWRQLGNPVVLVGSCTFGNCLKQRSATATPQHQASWGAPPRRRTAGQDVHSDGQITCLRGWHGHLEDNFPLQTRGFPSPWWVTSDKQCKTVRRPRRIVESYSSLRAASPARSQTQTCLEGRYK